MNDLPADSGPIDDFAGDQQLGAEVFAEQAEQAEQAQPVATERLAVVRLGEDLFGVAGRHSKEIVQVQSFTPLPRAPHHLLGIINLRGDILPLVDLHSVLGEPQGQKEKQKEQRLVLVVESTGMRIALTIDEIIAFDPIFLDEKQDLQGASIRARFGVFASGSLQHPLGRVILLDMPQLIDTLRIKK